MSGVFDVFISMHIDHTTALISLLYHDCEYMMKNVAPQWGTARVSALLAFLFKQISKHFRCSVIRLMDQLLPHLCFIIVIC